MGLALNVVFAFLLIYLSALGLLGFGVQILTLGCCLFVLTCVVINLHGFYAG